MSHFLENLWLVLTPNALNNMLFSQHRENSLGQQCSLEVLGVAFFFFLWLRVSEGWLHYFLDKTVQDLT